MKDQIPGDNSSGSRYVIATAITDVMKVTATFCVWPLCNRSGKKKKTIFTARQFDREKLQTKVLVHDNLSLWKGEAFEISQGGIGVMLENHLIIPGQTVTLHIKAAGKLPAFNAVCEVVSKKFETDRSKPIEYGFKFLSLTSEIQNELRKQVG